MADFGYRSTNLKEWVFNPSFGGGGLLDVGIYPLSLSSMIFGNPERITGMAHLGDTGVDEQSAAILGYKGGRMALIASAARTQTPHVAYILGTEGRIYIHFRNTGSMDWRVERVSCRFLDRGGNPLFSRSMDLEKFLVPRATWNIRSEPFGLVKWEPRMKADCWIENATAQR